MISTFPMRSLLCTTCLFALSDPLVYMNPICNLPNRIYVPTPSLTATHIFSRCSLQKVITAATRNNIGTGSHVVRICKPSMSHLQQQSTRDTNTAYGSQLPQSWTRICVVCCCATRDENAMRDGGGGRRSPVLLLARYVQTCSYLNARLDITHRRPRL